MTKGVKRVVLTIELNAKEKCSFEPETVRSFIAAMVEEGIKISHELETLTESVNVTLSPEATKSNPELEG